MAAVKAAAIRARPTHLRRYHKFGNRTFVTFARFKFRAHITGQELSATWTSRLLAADAPLLKV